MSTAALATHALYADGRAAGAERVARLAARVAGPPLLPSRW